MLWIALSLGFCETDKSLNSDLVLYTQAFKLQSNITILSANQTSGSVYFKQVQMPRKINRMKQIGSNRGLWPGETRFLASSQNTNLQHFPSEAVVIA